ncbi:MAG: RNA polymerase sigma factor [Bacilli bacterium]|nr:RNA polymerase sigma factor [Bacilli bacterium]
MADKQRLEELISLLKNGKMEFFDEFYYETKNNVYFTIISILKDQSLAEDIMQDTYLKILDSLSMYKENSNPFAWIITIARNLSLNEYNKRKKEVYVDQYEKEEVYGSVERVRDEEDTLMKTMYEVLNPKEIEVVVMHVVQEMTHKEIAEVVKKPLGTVLWIYNNALKKIRKKVGDEDEKNN